jgi:ribosomal protein S18 acetylase RimI-like enzyme
MSAARVARRPIVDEDLPFLLEVYSSTRAEELAVVPWTPTEKQAFLRMQFEAQHRHYQEHYADASFEVLLVDGEPAGRLYVHRSSGEMRIIDIALLPRFRQQGIGSALLRELLDEATTRCLPVTIHVERNNPALRLYRRLGFEIVSEGDVYYLMRRDAPAESGPGQ